MRIQLKNYDPANDSSPGSDVYRVKPGDDADNPGFDGVILLVDEGQCACGCGYEAKRVFRQGHDQRYKGLLVRAHLTGTEVTIIRDGSALSGPAMTFATGVGTNWGPYLERAAERYAVQSQRFKEAHGAPKKFKIKVGRWEYDAVVVSETDDSITFEYESKRGVKQVTQPKR